MRDIRDKVNAIQEFWEDIGGVNEAEDRSELETKIEEDMNNEISKTEIRSNGGWACYGSGDRGRGVATGVSGSGNSGGLGGEQGRDSQGKTESFDPRSTGGIGVQPVSVP
ncbi:hypothetical protein Pmani_006759 [Petrolisthes manimaculis]|uniref:Uncharacterized protein n=1 Tax=Petrolisthes manimaculis TaxID=1843537 RepID=A0AAE1Q8S1_9EUCA|nr:hypothetical protein Pmani_006759 [Petrolisthes manimaculis]